MVAAGRNASTRIYGVTPDYFAVRNWAIADGTMFDETQLRTSAKVCVIGQTVRNELFGDEDPLGQLFHGNSAGGATKGRRTAPRDGLLAPDGATRARWGYSRPISSRTSSSRDSSEI